MFSGLVANPCHEEPDALIAHVRIRGGPGWGTTLVYPTICQPFRALILFTVLYLLPRPSSSVVVSVPLWPFQLST